MEKIIGVVTTEFGFGPVSKAVYIIDAINRLLPEAEVVFWGEGYSKEYVSEAGLRVTIREKRRLSDESDYDCLINIMDTDLVERWNNKEKNMYFVDSLSWMWDKPIKGIEKIKRYFVQDYFVDESVVSQLSTYTNVSIVPPISCIIDAKERDKTSKKLLVVNYSGVHNPFTKKDYFVKYCYCLTNIILKYADGVFDVIQFTMNSDIASEMEKLFAADEFQSDIRFNFIVHDEFIKILCAADRVITNPGITTTLELLNNDCPYAYFMGANYSQILMTAKYKTLHHLENVISLNDFGVETEKLSGLPEEEGVRFVTRFIEELLDEPNPILEEYIRKVIEEPRERLRENNKKIPVIRAGLGQETIVNEVVKDLECVS